MGQRVVMVDWTRDAARVAVFGAGVHRTRMESVSVMLPRLAIKREQGDGLRVLAGTEAMAACEDAETLVFDHPLRDLPHLEDQELQDLLLGDFWAEVSRELVARGELDKGESAIGYLVTPGGFSLPLVEGLRAGSAGKGPLRFMGAINEAAALIFGFLRSAAFDPQANSGATGDPGTVCLVVADNEQTVEVACFDYAHSSPACRRILIRDFFRVPADKLLDRLRYCDWFGTFSVLAQVNDLALSPAEQAALATSLSPVTGEAEHQRFQLVSVPELKIIGGAHVAWCAAGYGPDVPDYEIAQACQLGLQINRQEFQPIVTKEFDASRNGFPHFQAQSFRLNGRPASKLRLNFYQGYSTRVADALLLGHVVLEHEDLARIERNASFTAVVRMDSPNCGEFTLGLMPENRRLLQRSFIAPGIVN